MGKTLNVTVLCRNDTAAKWTESNPILSKGELGVETDTGKFKFGDGVSAWTSLGYASGRPAVLGVQAPGSTDAKFDLGTLWMDTAHNKAYFLYQNATGNAVWRQIITPDDLSDLGAGDMLKAAFATNSKAEQGFVDKAIAADKLSTGNTIALSGDLSAPAVMFDGAKAVTLNAVLNNLVVSGTGCKITVNSKGLVTALGPLAVEDIPELPVSKVTGLGTAAEKTAGSAAGNVLLVGEDGKIDETVLPKLAITNAFPVENEEAMLTLDAQIGDIAVRADISSTFILKASPASILSNWLELKTPSGGVLTVNGQSGTVTLTTTQISEGTGLYFTEKRATANFQQNIAHTGSSALSDGAYLIKSTDSLILDGGNA